ncbi:MAG: hypothetical protein JRJ03_00260 [Deltaproteobacteria bacterium]|nr:hypothetical protein [Deltaproteobacteria bacterium]
MVQDRAWREKELEIWRERKDFSKEANRDSYIPIGASNGNDVKSENDENDENDETDAPRTYDHHQYHPVVTAKDLALMSALLGQD